MSDFLDVLALDAKKTVDNDYYEAAVPVEHLHVNLSQAITHALNCNINPIITEIKFASPSTGTIRSNMKVGKIARAMKESGAVAISVLTEPKHFKGSLDSFANARKAVALPILMKDIILSPRQLEAAKQIGADAVLLIQAVFDRGYSEIGVNDMISKAHATGLEVLLETHTKTEFNSAIQSEADVLGINNRNLATLKTNVNTTKKILNKADMKDREIVSESGINTTKDLLFLKKCGASAFLIGSAIMSANNIEMKVLEFVNAK